MFSESKYNFVKLHKNNVSTSRTIMRTTAFNKLFCSNLDIRVCLTNRKPMLFLAPKNLESIFLSLS